MSVAQAPTPAGLAGQTAGTLAGRRIAMIGPGPEGRGGIASVWATYRDAGLFDRWPTLAVRTHCEGSRLAKTATAARALWAYARALARGEVALAHVHMASRGSFWRKLAFCALTRAAGRPLLVHVHGSYFRDFHDRGGPLTRAAMRWCLAGADVVVALSPRWADHLRTIARRPDIAVLPNPLPAPSSAAALDTPPDRHDDGQRALNLLFLAQISPHKGTAELLEAFALVAAAHPRARLVVAGHGDDTPLRQRAQALGVADRVHFAGWVDGQAKRALLDSADLFVLPSHVEGVPMGILEAQNAGIAVVASQVGGVPDIIDHDRHGWLVPPRDVPALAAALGTLLGDPRRRERLAAAGRRRANDEFSCPRVLAQLEGLYRQTLARSQRSAA